MSADTVHQPGSGGSDAAKPEDSADTTHEHAVSRELIKLTTFEVFVLQDQALGGGKCHGESVLGHRLTRRCRRLEVLFVARRPQAANLCSGAANQSDELPPLLLKGAKLRRFRIRQGRLELVERPIYLVTGDHQRRTDTNDVSTRETSLIKSISYNPASGKKSHINQQTGSGSRL